MDNCAYREAHPGFRKRPCPPADWVSMQRTSQLVRAGPGRAEQTGGRGLEVEAAWELQPEWSIPASLPPSHLLSCQHSVSTAAGRRQLQGSRVAPLSPALPGSGGNVMP
jgi:hypothetical protein